MENLTEKHLRAFGGLILLLLALVFILSGAENKSLEYIMIALTGFLVGGAIMRNIQP